VASLQRRGVALALAVALLDQASKWLILAVVMQPPRQIVVAPFFNLVLVYNTGISFGLFNSGPEMSRWVLVGAALVIVALLAIWFVTCDTPVVGYGIALVVGGALSNVVDRLIHPGVVDFLDFHLAGLHWPAFNVADSAIVVGVALLLYDGLFGGHATAK
jgi:signal peptidase II